LAGIAAGKRLCYHAAALFDAWTRGHLDTPPVREISMAKLYSGDLAQRVAYDCMQFFGGMGYVTETPIARAWRDVRLLTIGGGTSEVMKEIIARTSSL
jgi:citronellyl-CoA dehydrogenase